MDERERRRQRRYREAMRNRVIAVVFLAALIVGIVFIVKGCRDKKQAEEERQQQAAEALAQQNTQKEPASAKPSAANNELLTLVNPWNKLPEDWQVDPVDLSNGLQVDRRCYDALQSMMDACREAGNEPLICSAYRSMETQQSLFDAKVAKLEAAGKSHDEAVQETAKEIAVPGTSEHQLGLTVDIVDMGNQNLTEEQEKTPTQKWLMANSWRYGFIHRYPNGKSDITGIIYEPWHYRYVGKEAAQEIFNKGITLEEDLGVTHCAQNKSRGGCRGSLPACRVTCSSWRSSCSWRSCWCSGYSARWCSARSWCFCAPPCGAPPFC